MIDPEKVEDPIIKKFLLKEISMEEYREMSKSAEIMKLMLEKKMDKTVATQYYNLRAKKAMIELMMDVLETPEADEDDFE